MPPELKETLELMQNAILAIGAQLQETKRSIAELKESLQEVADVSDAVARTANDTLNALLGQE
jgi:hypothetical protein